MASLLSRDYLLSRYLENFVVVRSIPDQIDLEDSFNLDDEFDAWGFARRAGGDFYKKMNYDWQPDEILEFIFYETESKIYRTDVMVEIEAHFYCGKIHCDNPNKSGKTA